MQTSIFSVLPSQTRSNYQHLYADTAWYGILAGSTLSFLTVYMARLGATSFQVGLLSAGPALVNLFFSLPAGRWLEHQPLIRSTFLTSVWQRAAYLLLIPLPWLLAEKGQVWAAIWVTLIMSVPGTALAIAFNALFADLVVPEHRSMVVGRRNALFAIVVTLTSLVCGQILVGVKPLLNYQIVFGMGALGALMSSYHLSRLKALAVPTPRVGLPTGDAAAPGQQRWLGALRAPGLRFLTRSGGKPMLRLDLLRGRFGPFLLAYLAFYTFQYLPLPLFPLYYVHVLNLSDAEISLGTAMFYALMMVFSLVLFRISARLGHKRVMVLSAAFFGGFPLILYMAHGAAVYWVASIYGGMVIALLSGSLTNRLMERVPEDDRPAHMALHNLALNIGVLAGSLLGPLMGNWIGLGPALAASAVLRFLAALCLAFWG